MISLFIYKDIVKMKVIKIIGFLMLGLFVFIQSYMTMATNRTEQQKYSIVRKYKDFEIRFYPSATFATITSNAKSYKDLSGNGFRKLAGYIFGDNESKTQISMTAPVHMDVNDILSSMSFVMPSDYNISNLPKPGNSNVIIKTTKDEYIAALRFGGFANDKNLAYHSEKLRMILLAEGIRTYGNYRNLGYNPPFQLFGRRNEIIVSVEWNEK